MRTAAQLLAGKNVVLQAPTGAGKTRAALFPWLYAREQGLAFADRIIYALPLRTLTSALYHDTKALLAQTVPDARVTIQMGSDAQDSFFEGDVIFTTIDQILSAYIGVPVSLSPRMANLPAGALIGAYVVFDEFHLLEPARALGTTLDLARRFARYSRLLLMTATFPQAARDEVRRRAHAEAVQVEAEELSDIPSQQGKERVFQWHDRPMQGRDIVDAHRDRTIAVVNRVERAQEMYRDVEELLKETEAITRPELLLLHARFLPEDRDRIEQDIRERFREGGSGNAILIATQTVEVGLDISADVLHSDVAPAASLFQRAGRCARFMGERGTVHVYDLPLSDRGTRRYGPYLHDQEALVDATAAEIAEHSGQRVGYGLEREIVDRVHSAADARALAEVNERKRAEDIERAITGDEPGWVAKLIREVDAVSVLVHDNPADLRMDRRPQMFSVDRNVFRSLLRDIDLGAEPRPVLVPAFGDDERQWDDVAWEPPTDRKAAGSQFIVCLHPSIASYQREIGLELKRSGTFRSVEMAGGHDASFVPYSYHREEYHDHVERAVARATSTAAKYSVARSRLAEQLGLRDEDIEILVLLAVALHDVGKLSQGWQDAIWRWQCGAFGTRRSGFLAHSDFDGSVAWQRAKAGKALYRKPPHAAEGAYASLPVLKEAATRAGAESKAAVALSWALASAIARHHGARTKELSDFTLAEGAEAEVLRSIDRFDVPATRLWRTPGLAVRTQFKDNLAAPGRSQRIYPLYLFAARRVRLADQESLEGG